MSGFTDPGGSSELIGVGIALLVLVLTFGSLVAAGLPILSALVGSDDGCLASPTDPSSHKDISTDERRRHQ